MNHLRLSSATVLPLTWVHLVKSATMRKETRSKAAKRRSSPATETPITSAPEVSREVNHQEHAAAAATQTERLALPLNEDGTIDTESMRSTTRERLKTAFSDPSLAGKLGLQSEQPRSAETLFTPMVCSILYEAASGVAMAIAVSRGGYTPEQASVLKFTRDEVETLAPLTGRVLDKWIPSSAKYQDEAMLALALFGIINGKLAMLRRPASVIHMVPDQPQSPETRPS